MDKKTYYKKAIEIMQVNIAEIRKAECELEELFSMTASMRAAPYCYMMIGLITDEEYQKWSGLFCEAYNARWKELQNDKYNE